MGGMGHVFLQCLSGGVSMVYRFPALQAFPCLLASESMIPSKVGYLLIHSFFLNLFAFCGGG